MRIVEKRAGMKMMASGTSGESGGLVLCSPTATPILLPRNDESSAVDNWRQTRPAMRTTAMPAAQSSQSGNSLSPLSDGYGCSVLYDARDDEYVCAYQSEIQSSYSFSSGGTPEVFCFVIEYTVIVFQF